MSIRKDWRWRFLFFFRKKIFHMLYDSDPWYFYRQKW